MVDWATNVLAFTVGAVLLVYGVAKYQPKEEDDDSNLRKREVK